MVPASATRTTLLPLLALTLGLGAGPGAGQTLQYIEAGVAGCPAPPAAAAASAPRPVKAGTAVVGRLRVSCGLDQGSYTVTLGSTDPGATVVPRTMLVNFGRVVGNGGFVVTFATPGVHGITTAITANMGSPPARGRFVGVGSEFEVVRR